MKIHEYQAKALFKAYGIPVPEGKLLRTVDEVIRHVEGAAGAPVVIKAQIHGGGRGKAGGIKVVRDAEEASAAAQLLGKRLYTSQTGAGGRPVGALLAEEAISGVREFYLGVVIDRPGNCVSVLAGAEGGVEVEKAAAHGRGRILTERAHPGVGLRPFQAVRMGYALGLSPSAVSVMSGIILNLFRLFMEKDCSLAEINPLTLTEEGRLVALDGKVDFDDNALFRHPDIGQLRDLSQENPLEAEAGHYNLSYIKLSGQVGCMVNGAGLAMATMDLVHHAGAEPANFLDVGGGATPAMVSRGLRLVLSDRDVKVVLVNIFGGILRCDTLAKGVAEAARECNPRVPIVVRLEGTNVEEGRKILAESGLSFQAARSMEEAAAQVAALLGGRG